MTILDIDLEKRPDWIRTRGRAVHVLFGTRRCYLELIASTTDEGAVIFGYRLWRWSIHVHLSGWPS